MPGNTSVEEYLEAIYKLAEAGAGPVSTTQVAERIGVSAASVSEMFRRLSDQGLVDHVPYRGASLTIKGSLEGARVLRNHRLWERFLVDVLGMEWDKVHEEACRLEHATSPSVSNKLAAFLDDPRTCPHGYAMPASSSAQNVNGDRASPGLPALHLSEAPPGFAGEVVAIDEDPDLLRHCARVGLTPGARFRIANSNPVDLVVEIVMTAPCATADVAGAGEWGDGAPPIAVGPGVGDRVLVRRHAR